LVDAADVQNLDVSIKTTDLPGRGLGRAAGNTIWIDRNAARRGWYIDSTPNSDLEFVAGTNVRGVDLLSVIGHELGHFLGFDHVDDSQVAVMHEKLRPGVRLLPASADDLEMIGISRSRAEAVLPTVSRIERLPNSTAAALDLIGQKLPSISHAKSNAWSKAKSLVQNATDSSVVERKIDAVIAKFDSLNWD
jgi:Matrixin